MGMFDYVDFTIPCPNCGTTVTDFQSKDGDCELQHLTVKELIEQSDGNVRFYSNCPNGSCNMWIEFWAHDDGIRIESMQFHLNKFVKHTEPKAEVQK